MLTCDVVATGQRYRILAIDEENGDPLIQRDDGQPVRVSRYLVTTPTERCDKCQRSLEFRRAAKVVDENKAICPDAEHHVYTELWREAHRSGLNRSQRRTLTKRASNWLSKHLKIKRGRSSQSNAIDADSTS